MYALKALNSKSDPLQLGGRASSIGSLIGESIIAGMLKKISLSFSVYWFWKLPASACLL